MWKANHVTRKRSPLHDRARELQAASHSCLSYSQARELALAEQTMPTAQYARAALRELAADPGVAETWRERIRWHLVQAAEPHWPAPALIAEFTADLAAAAGIRPPDEGAATAPVLLQHTWMPHLRVALAAVDGRRNLAAMRGWWLGTIRSASWSPADPAHRAAQQFAYAACTSLAGPLRPLLRSRYGVRPPSSDAHYRLLPEDGAVRPAVFDDDGLWLGQLPYPRPRALPRRVGSFPYRSASDRLAVARALLAHALGGTDAGSLAACPTCAGTGWLEPMHSDSPARGDGTFTHAAAVPGTGSGPLCLCGPCRGTGLRPLPAARFAEDLLTFPSGRWTMSRRAAAEWAMGHLPPVDLLPHCGLGLQEGYLHAVVGELMEAGLPLDMRPDQGFGPDFDYAGVLSGWITLRRAGASRWENLLSWSSDRGWVIGDRRAPAGASRLLCPGQTVPAPTALVASLTAAEPVFGPSHALPDQRLDAYAEVLRYLPERGPHTSRSVETAGPLR